MDIKEELEKGNAVAISYYSQDIDFIQNDIKLRINYLKKYRSDKMNEQKKEEKYWGRLLDCPKCGSKKSFREGYCDKCGYDVE